jgi:hypothetical protein
VSLSWLENHGKLNIGDKLDIIKEERNVKSVNKFIQIKTNRGLQAAGLDSIPADNRAGDSNADDIKWDAPKRTKTYIFRTYSEESKPTLTINPVPQEANFSKDKEKVKNKKRYSDAPTVSQRLRNTTGVGPEFDTRQQGTVYPMSGLGDVTYREQKEFGNFRKRINEYKGFQNDISISDMGVGGVLNGATNFEPMQSYKDAEKNIGLTITKKKKPVKEDAVSKLETGLTKLQKTDYDTIDKLMTRISKDEKTTGKDLHDDFVKKHGKVPDNWIKDKKQEK